MYDSHYFFVPNPINRYSISPRQNLKANADGSIELYVQKDSPGAPMWRNWRRTSWGAGPRLGLRAASRYTVTLQDGVVRLVT